MRQAVGLRRAAAVLVKAALVVGFLSGCGVAARPDDGARDLPHFASQARSKEMGPSPRLSVSAEAGPVISGAPRARGGGWCADVETRGASPRHSCRFGAAVPGGRAPA